MFFHTTSIFHPLTTVFTKQSLKSVHLLLRLRNFKLGETQVYSITFSSTKFFNQGINLDTYVVFGLTEWAFSWNGMIFKEKKKKSRGEKTKLWGEYGNKNFMVCIQNIGCEGMGQTSVFLRKWTIFDFMGRNGWKNEMYA